METYARKALREMSDISASDDVVDACKAFVQAMESVRDSRLVEVCDMPLGLYPVLGFPLQIWYIMSNIFSNTTLFELGRQIPISQWSSVW